MQKVFPNWVSDVLYFCLGVYESRRYHLPVAVIAVFLNNSFRNKKKDVKSMDNAFE
jgi:hypothetical protein